MVAETAGTVGVEVGDAVPVAGTEIGLAFVARTPARLEQLDVGTGQAAAGGPALVLPLRATAAVAGVLVTLRQARERPFTDEQLDMMAGFADQAALAWSSRPPSAGCANWMCSQTASASQGPPRSCDPGSSPPSVLPCKGRSRGARSAEVQQRLSRSVDDLQAVIQEIRTTIFDLHGLDKGSTRLRQRLDEAISAFAGSGVHTRAQFVGPLSAVDVNLADHAEAVVREAVSNAVRHAQATELSVDVKVADDLCIEVLDNGRGISGDITESGLANLRLRAQQCGGTFSVQNASDGGMKLRWSAPLP